MLDTKWHIEGGDTPVKMTEKICADPDIDDYDTVLFFCMLNDACGETPQKDRIIVGETDGMETSAHALFQRLRSCKGAIAVIGGSSEMWGYGGTIGCELWDPLVKKYLWIGASYGVTCITGEHYWLGMTRYDHEHCEATDENFNKQADMIIDLVNFGFAIQPPDLFTPKLTIAYQH
jgi:hypothetical protein